jgi:hypothetical protein
METSTIIITVTINKEARPIEFVTGYREGYASARSRSLVACRIGNGEKLHTTDLTAYEVNGVWEVSMRACVRNRQAKIVEWADKVKDTTKTKQNYYGGF